MNETLQKFENNRFCFGCVLAVIVAICVVLLSICVIHDVRRTVHSSKSNSEAAERTYNELRESIEESSRITDDLSGTNQEFERILEEIRKENINQK